MGKDDMEGEDRMALLCCSWVVLDCVRVLALDFSLELRPMVALPSEFFRKDGRLEVAPAMMAGMMPGRRFMEEVEGEGRGECWGEVGECPSSSLDSFSSLESRESLSLCLSFFLSLSFSFLKNDFLSFRLS